MISLRKSQAEKYVYVWPKFKPTLKVYTHHDGRWQNQGTQGKNWANCELGVHQYPVTRTCSAVLSISYDECISDTWYWWVGMEVTSLYVAREGQCEGAGSVECSGWPGDTQAGCGPGHHHRHPA